MPMSDKEKAQQIGELVLLRKERQQELEHLHIKRDKIARAYSVFGANKERWYMDAGLGSTDKVVLRMPAANERELPDYLLSQADLAAFLRELAGAEERLAETNGKLTALGL